MFWSLDIDRETREENDVKSEAHLKRVNNRLKWKSGIILFIGLVVYIINVG